MDRCITMNKTGQPLSPKNPSGYYYILSPLTAQPNGHSQQESTEQIYGLCLNLHLYIHKAVLNSGVTACLWVEMYTTEDQVL